ncbi:MAG: acyl carrier protein [Polyangiales bacterium]
MDIRQEVKQFITTNFYVADPAHLSDGQSLLDQGIVDSTGVLEVIAFIEEKFNFRVDDAEMLPENLDTIDNLVGFIERKKK